MREELRDFNWHNRSLSTSNFDYIIRVVEETISDRIEFLSYRQNQIIIVDKEGNTLSDEDSIGEIASDLGYYTHLQTYVLYEFGLWRLQGLFEGILKQLFFPERNLIGLRGKLRYVRDEGYTINQHDYEEIIKWGDLRNALSHYPPGKFDSTMIDVDDLREYADLAKRIVDDLVSQKDNRLV